MTPPEAEQPKSAFCNRYANSWIRKLVGYDGYVSYDAERLETRLRTYATKRKPELSHCFIVISCKTTPGFTEAVDGFAGNDFEVLLLRIRPAANPTLYGIPHISS